MNDDKASGGCENEKVGERKEEGDDEVFKRAEEKKNGIKELKICTQKCGRLGF